LPFGDKRRKVGICRRRGAGGKASKKFLGKF